MNPMCVNRLKQQIIRMWLRRVRSVSSKRIPQVRIRVRRRARRSSSDVVLLTLTLSPVLARRARVGVVRIQVGGHRWCRLRVCRCVAVLWWLGWPWAGDVDCGWEAWPCDRYDDLPREGVQCWAISEGFACGVPDEGLNKRHLRLCIQGKESAFDAPLGSCGICCLAYPCAAEAGPEHHGPYGQSRS